ncbi:MAG TPA: hypothetical protein VLM80_00745 [Anaerolineales bacterium]|nr:hypothetical protein [Anaerolineales bacterium]
MMTTDSTQTTSNVYVPSEGRSKRAKRPWSVTAVGYLLILQALFLLLTFPVLVGIEIYNLPDARLSWLLTQEGSVGKMRVEIIDMNQLEFLLDFSVMRIPVPSKVITSFAFSALTLPMLITAVLILRLWQHAWTIAIFLEGVILALSLFVYFNFHHPYIYLMMISGILMVFYLNYFEVQLAFNRYVKPHVNK